MLRALSADTIAGLSPHRSPAAADKSKGRATATKLNEYKGFGPNRTVGETRRFGSVMQE
jgi:hypothetical protein